MRHRWRMFALLCACPCLACPAEPPAATSQSAPATKASPEPPAPKPSDELLANALMQLAEQPAKLGEAPERMHPELGLDERFGLHRYSEGMGETERVGFSIRPKQDQVIASDFVKALGLEAAAHEQIPITDRNRERLANAGETPFVWKGLELEVELQPREDGHVGLSKWQISDVLVLPAPASKPEREPERVDGPIITITPDEATAAGLPKLGFSLDTTGAGMSGTKLRDGEYLHLSGPPGGPLLLRIGPATIGAKLEDVISRDHLEDAKFIEEQVELLGATRRAAAWVFGESLAKTSWCAVIVGPADAKPEDPALLLEIGVGHSGDAVACKTALEDPNMKPIIASLKLRS